MARVTTLGALTASIAHEVNQPLSGIITNASTCLRMLAADPPNVDGARETARRTIRDGNRASDVITRLRALFVKKDPTTEPVDLNEATREVMALSSSELQRSRVVLRPEFADDLPACHRRSCPASAGHDQPASERLGRDERGRRSSEAVGDQNRTGRRRPCAAHRSGCGNRYRPAELWNGSSTPSTRRRAAVWGSACRSAVPLSRVIMAACGRHRTRVRAPHFRFLFLAQQRFPRARRRRCPDGHRDGSEQCDRTRVMAKNGAFISVVDDDESVRESLPDLLRELGFAVEAFSSAEEFLASDRVSETRCLILDIAMPGMSGLDLQRELTRRRQGIPIVFITAHGDDMHSSTRSRKGCRGVPVQAVQRDRSASRHSTPFFE